MNASHAIRHARPGDAPEISRLLTELGHPATPDEVGQRWNTWEAQGNWALVAERGDGTLAGFCQLHRTIVLHRPLAVGRITAMVVDSAERGRGLGGVLVARAEAELTAAGCGLIEVTSNASRVRAHAFYERLGYERTSLRFAKDVMKVATSFALLLSGVTLLQSATPARASAQPHTAPVNPGFEIPAWLFPIAAPAPPVKPDSVTRLTLPNSKQSFTDVELRNRFKVADWYPESHPPMPNIVAHGRPPSIIACGLCHLPDGSGRPENAMLAGLPAAYIRQQVIDLKSRGRESAYHGKNGPIDLMRTIADSLTPAEITEAARYFSRVKARQRSKVVEAVNIPRVKPQTGLYFAHPDGGEEPLGQRLVEMPVESSRHELRDARTEYVAYVPVGSLARGRALATKGKLACTTCHGPELRGVGVVPPLAGRSPSYIVRELLAFKTGARFTVAGKPMRDVVAPLGIDDMIAAAAYAASRKP